MECCYVSIIGLHVIHFQAVSVLRLTVTKAMKPAFVLVWIYVHMFNTMLKVFFRCLDRDDDLTSMSTGVQILECIS